MKLVMTWMFAWVLLFFSVGCRTSRSECAKNQELNEKWKQGYGFNNPNPERIRKGLKPLNFDGTESKDDDDDIEEDFAEDLIVGIVGSVIGGIAETAFRKTFGMEKQIDELGGTNYDIYGPQDQTEAAELKEIQESLRNR